MAKEKMVCVPCGKEVVVDSCGCVTEKTIWCCGKPMKPKKKTAKKAHKKPAHKKAKKAKKR